MPARPDFDLTVQGRAGGGHRDFVKRRLCDAIRLLPRAPRELSVVLVGDAAMSCLHEQFLSIPGPTDVLTFPLDTDARGNVTAGEVYVCVPEARRQARTNGNKERDEVLLYALHGLLHLSGFDDTTDDAFDRMHRKEDQILTRLGIGRVFHSDAERRGASRPGRSRLSSPSRSR